jgi:hypothetical protein
MNLSRAVSEASPNTFAFARLIYLLLDAPSNLAHELRMAL